MVLKRCKAHNFGPSKQHISNKHFLIYIHFAPYPGVPVFVLSFLRSFVHPPHLHKMILNDLSRLRDLQLLIKHARLYFT